MVVLVHASSISRNFSNKMLVAVADHQNGATGGTGGTGGGGSAGTIKYYMGTVGTANTW
jgi:hypothetical protein